MGPGVEFVPGIYIGVTKSQHAAAGCRSLRAKGLTLPRTHFWRESLKKARRFYREGCVDALGSVQNGWIPIGLEIILNVVLFVLTLDLIFTV